MSATAIKRILNDIQKLQESPLDKEGIFWYIDEDNIFNFKALIIGPKDTPYEDGFYFFDFVIPENYPLEPPVAKYCTQFNNIRFNPNLYTCGKVCLSILNTWAGPSWTPCNTLSSVLISLLGMVFIDYPLTNEPGYENYPINILDEYNAIIEMASVRGATIYTLNCIPNGFEVFKPKIREYFVSNFDKYVERVKMYHKKRGGRIYHNDVYNIWYESDYISIMDELYTTYEKITGEKKEIEFLMPFLHKTTVQQLREIAKKHNIPTRADGKYKLKKQLYEDIKKMIQ